jgi:hypothetical protein
MKKTAAALAACLVMSAVAYASDPMESRYENTVTITDSAGAVTKIHYDRDGKLKIIMPDGTVGTGKWTSKEDKLCITLDAGPAAGIESCNPMAARKVGEEWEVALADGTKAKAALVKGRDPKN